MGDRQIEDRGVAKPWEVSSAYGKEAGGDEFPLRESLLICGPRVCCLTLSPKDSGVRPCAQPFLRDLSGTAHYIRGV